MHLDTGAVVSLLWNGSRTARAEAFMAKLGPAPIMSDHAGAKSAATVSRPAPISAMAKPAAASLLSRFEAWTTGEVQWASTTSADLALASGWMRRLDLTLRAADAGHAALTRRLGQTLVTFDAGMTSAARHLDVPVAAA